MISLLDDTDDDDMEMKPSPSRSVGARSHSSHSSHSTKARYTTKGRPYNSRRKVTASDSSPRRRRSRRLAHKQPISIQMDDETPRRRTSSDAVQNPIIVNGCNEEDDDVQCIGDGFEAPLIMSNMNTMDTMSTMDTMGAPPMIPPDASPFMPSASVNMDPMDQYVACTLQSLLNDTPFLLCSMFFGGLDVVGFVIFALFDRTYCHNSGRLDLFHHDDRHQFASLHF